MNHIKTQREVTFEQESGPSRDTESVPWPWSSRSPRTIKTTFQLFISYLVCGILLQQPDQIIIQLHLNFNNYRLHARTMEKYFF